MGDMQKALDFFQKRAQLGQELFEANPKSESLKNGLAISYEKLGETHQAMGDMQKALDFFQKRAQLGLELFEANPRNVAMANGLAVSYGNLGIIHRELKDDRASGFLRKALSIWEPCTKEREYHSMRNTSKQQRNSLMIGVKIKQCLKVCGISLLLHRIRPKAMNFHFFHRCGCAQTGERLRFNGDGQAFHILRDTV